MATTYSQVGRAPEEVRVEAPSLVDTYKRLVHEGLVGRIVVKCDDGHIVAELPLPAQASDSVFFPQLAASAALAALSSHYTLLLYPRNTGA